MTEKELVQNAIDEVERKIKALDFINSIEKEIGNLELWRPMADCPFWGRLKKHQIEDCYLNRLKEKSKNCCIINPTSFCKCQLNKKRRSK